MGEQKKDVSGEKHSHEHFKHDAVAPDLSQVRNTAGKDLETIRKHNPNYSDGSAGFPDSSAAAGRVKNLADKNGLSNKAHKEQFRSIEICDGDRVSSRREPLKESELSRKKLIALKDAVAIYKKFVEITPSQRLAEQKTCLKAGIHCSLNINNPLERAVEINGSLFVNLPPPGKSNEILPARVKDLKLAGQTDALDKELATDLSKANCHRYGLWHSLKGVENGHSIFQKLDGNNATVLDSNKLRSAGFVEIVFDHHGKVIPDNLPIKAGDLVTVAQDNYFASVPLLGELNKEPMYKHTGVVVSDGNGNLEIMEKFGSSTVDSVYFQTMADFAGSWAGHNFEKIHIWRHPNQKLSAGKHHD